MLCGAMEPSGVWKNLLSGKQAVPTVACPSCGAQVPEFRIHSHLDTCLTTLPVAEVGEGSGVRELSDGGEQGYHRRGRGRGRGRGRKRREAGERRGKRSRHDVEGEKELDAAAAAEAEADTEEEEEYGRFYQRWEYSVAGLDESRKEVHRLSEVQKRELLSSGVVALERSEITAMVLQLDRLLDEFQTSASSHTADANRVRQDGAQSDQGKATEAWWEQWATVEWPEGPLPSGFHAGLPPRLESELRADLDVDTGTEKVGMGRSAAQETIHHTINSILNFSESGGIIGGRSGVVAPSSEPLNKSGRGEAIKVGMQSGSMTSRGDPTRGTELSSSPNVGRSTVAESSARRSEPPSSSTAPAKNPAETSGASPGLQACPICNSPFPPEASNTEINNHIDQCLTEMACQFD